MSKPSRPLAVLFDAEGVIVHPDPAALDRGYGSIWPGLTLEAVEAARDRADLYALWERYSVGALDRAAYWTAVITALGRPADADRIAALADVLADAWWATVDPDVIALIHALRDGRPPVRIGILSNSCADQDRAAGAFAPLFDVECFSHRVGRRKPSAEAFVGAADALGVPLDAVLFIDDMERNTRAAERAGMTAIRFTGAEALRAALTARGLLESARVA